MEQITIDKKKLYRSLAVVVLPIALQQLISSSLSLVDNLMIGSMGEAELAAVGLATQFYFIHWMMLFGFSSGCNTFLSQFFGTGDWKSFRKVVGFVITVAVCAGTVFFLAAMFIPETIMGIFTDDPGTIALGAVYIRTGAPCFLCIAVNVPFTAALRVSEQASIPLRNSSIAFFGNTFLNYVFIFGKFGCPAMGVKGAALATVFCRVIEVSLTLFAVFVRRNVIAEGVLRLEAGVRGTGGEELHPHHHQRDHVGCGNRRLQRGLRSHERHGLCRCSGGKYGTEPVHHGDLQPG